MNQAQIAALADIQLIDKAIIDNAADAVVVAALQVRRAEVVAANAVQTPAQQTPPGTTMAYDARTRIPLTSNILPKSITLVAVGAQGTATAAQVGAGMVPVMVQLKVEGQLRWTAATIMNGAAATAENLTLSVSSYINKAKQPAYSLDASFGGRQAAVRVGIDQLREEVEYAKLQAELFLAQNSVVKDGLATSILRKQDEQLSKATKD